MARIIAIIVVIVIVWMLLRKPGAGRSRGNENAGSADKRGLYCEILGIGRDAGNEEIKDAYRNKIKEYHPDKFHNQPEWVKKQAVEMTQKINEAYKYLG
jgi:preprotein translocase subunit Sec63